MVAVGRLTLVSVFDAQLRWLGRGGSIYITPLPLLPTSSSALSRQSLLPGWVSHFRRGGQLPSEKPRFLFRRNLLEITSGP